MKKQLIIQKKLCNSKPNWVIKLDFTTAYQLMLDNNVLPVLPASLEGLREIRTAGTEDAAMGRNLLSMDVKCDIFMHPHLQQSGNVRD